MDESIRLGRIAGIPIGANWSVLLIIWLLSWSLATRYLPESRPGYSMTLYWIVGVLAALLFFSSLLAHEFGHAIVARRHDVGVEGITLWLFGGVSRLERDAADPSSDLRIALAGPAVSFSIAIGAGVIAASLSAAGLSPLLVGAATWLATVNAVLGIFNLIPAAPLDGGRVLRAVVWSRTGDHLRGQLTACAAGRTFGYVLVALGVLQFALGLWLSGVWFVFLGLFLLNAARAEQLQAFVVDALTDVPVGEVMTPHPVTIDAGVTVATLLDEVVLHRRYSTFPVTDPSGRVTGLLTMHHVRGVVPQRRPATTVGEISTPLEHIVTSSPDEPAVEVLQRLSRSPDGRALVFERDSLVGIVTPTDVMRISQYAMVSR